MQVYTTLKKTFVVSSSGKGESSLDGDEEQLIQVVVWRDPVVPSLLVSVGVTNRNVRSLFVRFSQKVYVFLFDLGCLLHQ